MIARAAREIRNRELVFVGMRLPLLAFLLARSTHAPKAVGLFENGVLRDTPARDPLITMSDSPNILEARMCMGMETSMGLLQAGRVSLGFIGGAEVDRYGNLNTTRVRDGGREVRLPGSGGACDIACLAERLVVIMKHEKRRLVERVSYVTSPGYGTGGAWRESQGLVRGGPATLITDKAVFSFHPRTREMVLSSVHPGIDVSEVAENTGWPVRIPPSLPVTPEPSETDLEVIRRYDPEGFWSR
ncbi:MAG: CoA-transferase [Deltaproteobacteria bacterium]|nr:CoA-transferase [Deltaproteobacteria bacterium]